MIDSSHLWLQQIKYLHKWRFLFCHFIPMLLGIHPMQMDVVIHIQGLSFVCNVHFPSQHYLAFSWEFHWFFYIICSFNSAEDAKEALRYDVSGIVVSNHGGRQLDGTLATVSIYRTFYKAVSKPVIIATNPIWRIILRCTAASIRLTKEPVLQLPDNIQWQQNHIVFYVLKPVKKPFTCLNLCCFVLKLHLS